MTFFIGGFCTETNTFSPLPTGAESFYDPAVYRRSDASLDPDAPWTAPQRVWRTNAERDGHRVVESINAFAQPAGRTVRAVYEQLRDTLLDDLRAAMPVDAVLLFMHGAMVADGYDDCEGDTLARVREIVGPDVPVGVELDLHCHLTPLMVAQATAIITFKEYPHTDLAPRAEELYALIHRVLKGEIAPVSALHRMHMVGIWRTSLPAVRRLVDRMQALEAEPGVLSVSFAHGFPWGDVAEAGARMLVVTDGDPALAERLAETLAREFWAVRAEAATPYLSVDAAIDRALAAEAGPIALADVADNAGGGAPSDSAFILERLVARGVSGAALGYVWDPVAVRLCIEAGEGARFDLRICGKLGPASGAPVDLEVTVERIVRDHRQTGLGGTPAPLGDSVWVSARGIDIVLTSMRAQPFHPDGFTGLGIDLSARRIIVVKSMQHFYAAFRPVVADVLYVTTPGAIPPEFETIAFSRLATPYWPRVPDPFAVSGDLP